MNVTNRLVDFARQSSSMWEEDDSYVDPSSVYPSGAGNVVARTTVPRSALSYSANPQRPFLIVDDSEMNRKLVARTVLQVYPGAKLSTADDGDTGVAAMRQAMKRGDNFQVVFIDLKMKKMHGPEAIRIMRQELGYSNLIVVLTGSRVGELESAAELLADYMMEKPISQAHLELMFLKEGILQTASNRSVSSMRNLMRETSK
jgi:CheY-like chemotaxis protein